MLASLLLWVSFCSERALSPSTEWQLGSLPTKSYTRLAHNLKHVRKLALSISGCVWRQERSSLQRDAKGREMVHLGKKGNSQSQLTGQWEVEGKDNSHTTSLGPRAKANHGRDLCRQNSLPCCYGNSSSSSEASSLSNKAQFPKPEGWERWGKVRAAEAKSRRILLREAPLLLCARVYVCECVSVCVHPCTLGKEG